MRRLLKSALRGHEVHPLLTGLGDPPRRVEPLAVGIPQPRRHHDGGVRRKPTSFRGGLQTRRQVRRVSAQVPHDVSQLPRGPQLRHRHRRGTSTSCSTSQDLNGFAMRQRNLSAHWLSSQKWHITRTGSQGSRFERLPRRSRAQSRLSIKPARNPVLKPSKFQPAKISRSVSLNQKIDVQLVLREPTDTEEV